VKGIEPPKATVPVIYPYKPPEIGDVSYHSKAQDSSNPSAITSVVKEIPVVTRIYSDLESHYVEEPISMFNQETKSTAKILEVPQVVNTWAAANKIKKEVKNPAIKTVSETDFVHENGMHNGGLKMGQTDPVTHSEESQSSNKEKNKDSDVNGCTSSNESKPSDEGEVSVPSVTVKVHHEEDALRKSGIV
jgi:hypothetical protein